MRSPKTLVYAFLVRGIVLGAYFYMYRTIPSLTAGIIGALMGLAAGVYIDRGRYERDISDNLAAGLVLSAIFRFADIYYGISILTPVSYRRGLAAISFAVILSALSIEVKRGVPAKVPILGVLAVIVAFILVFSAVTTITIEKTTRCTMADTSSASRINGLDYVREYESSTGIITTTSTYAPHNATGSITRTLPTITRTDASGVSHTADRVVYVGILIRTKNSNHTRTAGTYQFEITLTVNSTQPDVKLIGYSGGHPAFEKILLENSIDVYRLTITLNVTLTSSDVKLLNTMDRVLIELDRGDNGANNYPSLPLTVTISRAQIEQETVSTSYLIMAIIALAIAVVDALPLEDTKRYVRRRRKRRVSKARR